MKINGRALHFVLKVADRNLTAKFYRDILGMKILRHEEFTEGCEAQCNGPYDNRWSKTMVGYGKEDDHFVIELTYNYNVHTYELGNDFVGITLRSSQAIANAKRLDWPLFQEGNVTVVQAPGGYNFYLINDKQPTNKDPVEKVTLAISNLQKSLDYWAGILGMDLTEKTEKSAILSYGEDQAKLELKEIGVEVEHRMAYGRIAFSVPMQELASIEKLAKESGNRILTPLIKLDTPGKESVHVVILADPDNHEICFVGDEAFRKLSAMEEGAEAMLDKYIAKDEKRMNQ